MSLKYRALNLKRAVVTAGACAIGAAGLHGANVTGLTPQEQSKWWILSGEINTFYDDNTFNQPDKTDVQSPNPRVGTKRIDTSNASFGTQLKPGVAINLPLDRTLLNASYDYTLDYYENRPQHKIDESHRFETRLNHKFSPRYDIDISDIFEVSDQPAVPGQNQAANVSGRLNASNTRNRAAIEFNALMTPVFGLMAGYGHDLTDYRAQAYSQSLDNTENSIHMDARWLTSQRTIWFTGYRLGFVDYTGPIASFFSIDTNSVVGVTNIVIESVSPTIKNALTHTFYFGAEQELGPRLETQWRLGVSYADYYNRNQSSWVPYLDGTATYTYQRNSTIQFGANINRYPTDTGIGDANETTLDVLAFNIFAAVNHRFTARITGNAQFNYQRLIYNGGLQDGLSDDYYSLSLGASYQLREYLWATAAYSYSTLKSGRIGGSAINYDKNRISLGIRATY